MTALILQREGAAPPSASVSTVVETHTPTTAQVDTPYVEAPYVPPAAPTPTGSVVVQGGDCFESEARSFSADADGQSLICTAMGAGRFAWVPHAPDSGEVHNIGDPCDSTVDSVARDPDGKGILCSAGTWYAGP